MQYGFCSCQICSCHCSCKGIDKRLQFLSEACPDLIELRITVEGDAIARNPSQFARIDVAQFASHARALRHLCLPQGCIRNLRGLSALPDHCSDLETASIDQGYSLRDERNRWRVLLGMKSSLFFRLVRSTSNTSGFSVSVFSDVNAILKSKSKDCTSLTLPWRTTYA